MNDLALERCQRAAELLRAATAVIVTCGAGMSSDSGLPDYRGNKGFWTAYPPYRELGIRLVDLADSRLFRSDPALAWGFYGHRYRIYRDTRPHAGYRVLRELAAVTPSFFVTSNVDGHFEAAGVARECIWEIHGSIHHVQPARRGVGRTARIDDLRLDIDPATMRVRGRVPTTATGTLLRPNILMFYDDAWNGAREQAQAERFYRWLYETDTRRTVIVEIGAGTAIPSIRFKSERLARQLGARLIRINPGNPQCSSCGGLSIVGKALETLAEIGRRLD